MARLGHAVANGEGTSAAMNQGRSIAADRGGFQLDDDEDLLPREVIHKSGARIQMPVTRITAEGSRAVDLIQSSYCTMARSFQMN
jgi:hypothetical protein